MGERHIFAGVVSWESSDLRSRVVRVVRVASVVGVVGVAEARGEVAEASSATTNHGDSAPHVLMGKNMNCTLTELDVYRKF